MTPAINMNISNCPTFSGVNFLVITTVTIRKVIGRNNWINCSPEILFMNFNFFKSIQILNNFPLIAISGYKKILFW